MYAPWGVKLYVQMSGPNRTGPHWVELDGPRRVPGDRRRHLGRQAPRHDRVIHDHARARMMHEAVHEGWFATIGKQTHVHNVNEQSFERKCRLILPQQHNGPKRRDS